MSISEKDRMGDVLMMEAPSEYSREDKGVTTGEVLAVGDICEADGSNEKKVVVAANANAVALVDFPGPNLQAASAILTLTAVAADTETVTIDGKVYTFQTTLTDVDGNVLHGSAADDSIDNLMAAINLGAGDGVEYAASMTEHSSVTAEVQPGDKLKVVSKSKGEAQNAKAVSETLAAGSWDNTTLKGGVGLPRVKGVFAMRHCVVKKGKLNYNSQTVATVDTALEALGILPRD